MRPKTPFPNNTTLHADGLPIPGSNLRRTSRRSPFQPQPPTTCVQEARANSSVSDEPDPFMNRWRTSSISREATHPIRGSMRRQRSNCPQPKDMAPQNILLTSPSCNRNYRTQPRQSASLAIPRVSGTLPLGSRSCSFLSRTSTLTAPIPSSTPASFS